MAIGAPAHVHESSSIEAATPRLATTRYGGMLLSLDEHDAALDLLERLRAGHFASSSDLPVEVMADTCDAELALRMKAHEVCPLVLKPFKVKTLLESVGALTARAAERETA